ncbi:EAL domain-containing protein [Ketobacter sp.]|uniref:EAL domain-containing protein n=1 Tax=Ketobacter sp. TaxID=2083498 RepID=UPI000F0F47F2|nr:EAL domain-containing protein [Ketobacter sp.]RLT92106.1 MAG: EAL domain-containing protein [Ketobacter sp.]
MALETITLGQQTEEIHLTRQHIEMFEDQGDRLTINEITTNRSTLLFSPSNQDVINLGHTDSSIWVHFQVALEAGIDSDQTWILESEFPLLQRFDIFVTHGGELLQQYGIGYSIPMSERRLPHRFFAQPLTFEPGQVYDVFINTKRAGGNVQLPLKLSQPLRFVYRELVHNHVFGLFFGVLIAMMAYNLFLFFSVGNRAYFYYITYIGFSFLTFQTFTGFGFLLVWYNAPGVNEYITQIAACMAAVSGLMFVKHFIKTEQYGRAINSGLNLLALIGLGLALLRLGTDYFLSAQVSTYITVISIIVPGLVFYCWWKGSRPAAFFLIAWALLIVGIVMFTLVLLGLLPSNAFTNNAVLAGSAAEMLLLSLGLADRINYERKAKYSALQEQHKAVVRLKEAEDRLIHRALHSRTTGLPNRTLLRSTLDLLLQEESKPGFSVVLLSINNFHEFNKTLGHSNGDAILAILTERLNSLSQHINHIVPIEDSETRLHYVANVEGVSFALLVRELDPNLMHKVVWNLLRDMEKPFEYQGLTLDVDATAGIAFHPAHGNSSENLLRNAHIALEAAGSTNEKFAVYSPEIDPYNQRRISLLGELRNAIEQDGLQLYFQPQIALDTLQVSGAEVLIRWIHPEYGFIPPDEFIPLAERTGVIQPLTYWICRKAFEFKQALSAQGFDISLSINISARNLQDPHFKDQVCQIAQETNISLEKVIMELTETAVMHNPDDALRVMGELSAAGIRLSIDDFGTGYSSLSYLKKLPVNEIKIDRSFVMEMAKNNDDQVIVHTTLTMGHNLSLDVVAEGIEDAATLDKLKEMGCDLAQGYHIARPMPAADFFTWLANYQTEPKPALNIKGL